jgi:predicted nucleic acid-binding protein
MIVISDTSPLIHLAACNHLHLLKLLYGQIVIPISVDEEIRLKGKDEDIKLQVSSADWIITKSAIDRKLVNQLDQKLDGAEAEAIVLAIELNADLLLIDEGKGRTIAQQFHLKTGGVLSVLIEAKRQKLIPDVKPLIEQMIQLTGFRISEELLEEIWRIVEE